MGISFRYMPCQVPSFWRQIQYFSNSLAMAKKRGSECCAFGCSKRRKLGDESCQRSDSEGSSDEESLKKTKIKKNISSVSSFYPKQ